MLDIKRKLGVPVKCDETTGSLYKRLIRKCGLKDSEKGIITLDITITRLVKLDKARGARKK